MKLFEHTAARFIQLGDCAEAAEGGPGDQDALLLKYATRRSRLAEANSIDLMIRSVPKAQAPRKSRKAKSFLGGLALASAYELLLTFDLLCSIHDSIDNFGNQNRQRLDIMTYRCDTYHIIADSKAEESTMEHFAVVQSIIKAALSGDEAAMRKQVSRLEARLRKNGAEEEVATLERLLKASTDVKEMAPSQVEISRALIAGETLTTEVHPPIDRETGAQLCLIDFPGDATPKPVYGAAAHETIDGLLGEWWNGAALQAVGVEPTRSLLIYGPPGTGKTLTAHYIAEQLQLPLVTARIDGLISSFLGTTARNIANLFDFANRYACVLLLDEFDALAKLRDDPHEVGEIKRVVNTLLQNLDRRRAFGVTIAITNHDGLLDSAVWRRFETQLFISEPEHFARESLIRRFLEPIKVDWPTVRVFSYCLPGRSGADLERICHSVKRSVAMTNEKPDASALFTALSGVLGRMPQLDHAPARILAEDHQAFVSLIANDPDIGLDQREIGRATGTTQSRVSTLKREKRHVDMVERVHAQ